MDGIEWQQLEPDEHHIWLTEGLRPEFADFLPIGTHEAKDAQAGADAIFSLYSGGMKTNRDAWAYNYSRDELTANIRRFIETYNSEVDRWKRRGGGTTDVDSFVSYDDARTKWSEGLKADLKGGNYISYSEDKVRSALYRPFCRQWLYFDHVLNERAYQLPHIFPTPTSEIENTVIVVSDHGYRSHFSAICTNLIPELHFMAASDAFQCFPYYVYNEDGSGRRENITDWALARFQAAYGPDVTKRDIFAYVYGALHHPRYRERYAANLKRELPRIPLVAGAGAFREVVRIGGALAALHLGYEDTAEYPLAAQYAPGQPVNWRVGEKRMRLSSDKTTLAYNDWLTLSGIPAEVYRYRLGNRSALEWVIDQYHIGEDSRSHIVSDPNRPDDEQYIVRLIKRVVTVSLETVRLVDALAGVEMVVSPGG
jgi:predicted helicase